MSSASVWWACSWRWLPANGRSAQCRVGRRLWGKRCAATRSPGAMRWRHATAWPRPVSTDNRRQEPVCDAVRPYVSGGSGPARWRRESIFISRRSRPSVSTLAAFFVQLGRIRRCCCRPACWRSERRASARVISARIFRGKACQPDRIFRSAIPTIARITSLFSTVQRLNRAAIA